MITVKQLIEVLKKENPNAIVLIQGEQYGMEFLRTKEVEAQTEEDDYRDYYAGLLRGKFNLPTDTDKEDIFGSEGTSEGNLQEDENGDTNFLLFKRT